MLLSLRIVRHSSKPSISGSITSRMATSKPPWRSRFKPSLGRVACCRSNSKRLKVRGQRRSQLFVVVDQQQADHHAVSLGCARVAFERYPNHAKVAAMNSASAIERHSGYSITATALDLSSTS